jgi:hypothetical protein
LNCRKEHSFDFLPNLRSSGQFRFKIKAKLQAQKTYESDFGANVYFETFLASYQITKYVISVRNYVDIHYDLTLEAISTNILGSTNSGSNTNKPKFT